jgi:hypothetical protein
MTEELQNAVKSIAMQKVPVFARHASHFIFVANTSHAAGRSRRSPADVAARTGTHNCRSVRC